MLFSDDKPMQLDSGVNILTPMELYTMTVNAVVVNYISLLRKKKEEKKHEKWKEKEVTK